MTLHTSLYFILYPTFLIIYKKQHFETLFFSGLQFLCKKIYQPSTYFFTKTGVIKYLNWHACTQYSFLMKLFETQIFRLYAWITHHTFVECQTFLYNSTSIWKIMKIKYTQRTHYIFTVEIYFSHRKLMHPKYMNVSLLLKQKIQS